VSLTMNKVKLVIVGGGGHCKSLIDFVEQMAHIEIIGIIDNDQSLRSIFNYPVIGVDEIISEFIKQNPDVIFHVGIGQVKNNRGRVKVFQNLVDHDAQIINLIAPSSHVSRHAKLENGNAVMQYAMINADCVIGSNNIFNTRSTVEHETRIGSHCHISTHAVVNGNCDIGDHVFIGSNATILQGVQIANEVTIGAGAVVINNLLEKGTYVGCPAQKL